MLLEQVIKTIKKYSMITSGDHIVVGVSGGADSVTLLHILNDLKDRLNLTLTVAHLDHMIRGEASKKEGEFVRALADRLGSACVIEQRDVRAHKKQKGLSLQEAARAVRYEFFQDVVRQTGAHRIALGHTADDQAETVLMRLLRGASLKGLSGIPPVRDGIIIRPLLHVTRQEIEAYLHDAAIPYVPDQSASETHYVRNKIRHELLPLLRKEYNPRIITTLSHSADTLREDETVLEEELERIAAACMVKRQDEISCSLEDLKKHSSSFHGRLLRKIISELKGDTRGLSFKHVSAVLHLIEAQGPSRVVQLPGGWCVWREYDNLIFTRLARNVKSYQYTLKTLPDSLTIPELGRTLSFRMEQPGDEQTDLKHTVAACALLDYDEIEWPLVVRNWHPGDRFYPLGLGRSKKIKDFFSDGKIPLRERHRVPLLLSGERIAWVCGCRIDDRFKVKPQTRAVLNVWID